MRIPTQLAQRARPRRRTIVILAVIAAIILLLVLGQALAGFYANFLWFHFSGVGNIWTAVTLSKVLLAVVFVLIAGGFLFACLTLVDTVVARTLFLGPDTELVRRYQSVVAPHALTIRIGVSAVVGLALGSGASSQWQHWLLFEHAVPFGQTDPEFHRDISFFVFRLPFLSFLVDWMLGTLIVAFIITAIAYFLNGAIRLQGSVHVEPRAIAHLSLLLSLMALERSWAYYFVDRFTLDLSTNGVVQGAGYTDVHVRLPAMELLAVVSLIAFVILAFNVYQRTWTLPAIAIGLWALLALTLGVVFPALVQAIRVTPAQSTLELPYIQRNITATRQAMGIANVQAEPFPASQDLTPAVLSRYQQLLSDVQLWDPTLTASTFTVLQNDFNFYSLTNLAVDRYDIDGKVQPVVIGVRALNTSGLQSQTWVNTHLEYTHGYGVVAAQANTNNTTAEGGNPPFLVANVPETTSVPSLKVTQPDVYFAPGDEQYVVVDTKQAEVEYEGPNSTITTTQYHGTGGIPISNFAARLAFSVHLHDFNLLISNDITSKSRLIYIPDVRTEVQKALPFLAIDSNPYPVIDDGQIDWIVDGYTETSSYPYAEAADTEALNPTSGLQGDYNYVRDAVKVVVNAYSGKMTVYAMAGKDPILESWEHVFPGLIRPMSSLDATLRQHLRYPQDLLELQAQMYGLYHVTSPSVFYGRQEAWIPSPTSNGTNGSPSKELPSGPYGVLRYQPIYEMMQLEGDTEPTFRSVEPLIRYTTGETFQYLTSLLMANSAYGSSYGSLISYDTPSGSNTIDSPGLANADILADPQVSSEITLFDSKGSSVTLGTVQILPIADSLLYVRPLYISSSQTNYPLLEDVIVLYGKQVSLAPTLDAALADIFGASPSPSSTPSSRPSGTVSAAVRADLSAGLADYRNAQHALADGDLGTYQKDIEAAGSELEQANELAQGSVSSVATTPSTSTTPASTSTTAPSNASTSTSDPSEHSSLIVTSTSAPAA